ncbi:TAXI family TRAP transporter solute-binding subunit [Rhodoplanes sp. TEM]|uniref:TAXI family TRAP transporter solute-binding subunit n=1 Tax=Rhodoplanes tepidamans TaxID=200616 RepID=A0ABT5J3U5_RHOTP|nr:MULTISPECIES: TAXI family TRAP transporter solute-binding subunit [Rhodoplanes]MDC7784116.1 TAXI family TRAP transporter solute-binding subunit [Rhodoplanes tepidamans]MDC7983211.1 TAXI family TRAP transporter solute-binding subunit [Rhodoplanes sp. TEM]MDQ0356787.1 TRAP-type uncharacterized transport system substrate-binding protein [Rhodoplanes tepidamans]
MMCRVAFLTAALLVLAADLAPRPAVAQAIPQSLQESGPEATLRQRKNAWTVGIVGGLIDGSSMRFVDELAKALDDGDDLRILPIVSYGNASNLEDLLYLHGVDAAVTQADVFEYFRVERRTPNLAARVNYVLPLPMSDLHILAREEIRTIQDLRGKKVNFGPPGSGSSLTGSIVFQRLGIPVEQVMTDQTNALHQLRSGAISALIRVVTKPVDFFNKIPPGSGLHLLSVPFSKSMADYYGIGEFTEKDYPNLVPAGRTVDTVAVPSVLAVYNWPANHPRRAKIDRMVTRLFDNWDKLQKPPYHPKWRDINPAATVPGWTRFPVAEQMLQKMRSDASSRQQSSLRNEFQEFLTRSGAGAGGDREALFRQFLQWQQSRGAPPR